MFSYDKLFTRLQQIAFLNKRLRLSLRDERDGQNATFYSEVGIPDYVAFLNTGETVEYKFNRSNTMRIISIFSSGYGPQQCCFVCMIGK